MSERSYPSRRWLLVLPCALLACLLLLAACADDPILGPTDDDDGGGGGSYGNLNRLAPGDSTVPHDSAASVTPANPRRF